MSAIAELFQEVPPPPNCEYLLLSDATPCHGIHGPYIKLYCFDDTDLPIEATADAKHFHLLEPYIEILRKARQSPGDFADTTIPVFKGDDGRWRFSWLAASRDYPDRVEPTPSPQTYVPDPAMEGRAFRMQVSVPGTLAERFKALAAQRGMRHTDLLLSLIRDAVI